MACGNRRRSADAEASWESESQAEVQIQGSQEFQRLEQQLASTQMELAELRALVQQLLADKATHA